MAGTDYDTVKSRLYTMLASLISDAAAAGIAVLHPEVPFTPKSHEGAQVNQTSGGLRNVWFEGGNATRGTLAQGTGNKHTIQNGVLHVQYPSGINDLDSMIFIDSELIRTRLPDTKYHGWPDSGLLSVRVTSQAKREQRNGGVLMDYNLSVQYMAKTF